MAKKEDDLSNAEILASLVIGGGQRSHAWASVQRSHRFPLHLFSQIENMAQMGGVPVSVIINDVIECGLDAVKQALPEDVAREVARISKEQLEQPTVTDSVGVTRRTVGGKPKLVRGK